MASEATGNKLMNIPPEVVEKFLRGQIDLGQMVGFPRSAQYAIATLGHNLLEAGRLQEAETLFKGLVALSPLDSVFHCHLATIYARQKRVDEALASYTHALSLNKASVDALAGLGEMKLLKGQVLEATELLKQAIAADTERKYDSGRRAAALLLMLKTAAERQQAGPQAAGQQEPAPLAPPAPPAPRAVAKK